MTENLCGRSATGTCVLRGNVRDRTLPAVVLRVQSLHQAVRGMNFSSSKDESLLWLWESVRRQVLVDRASGGRSRCAGDSLRAYAELLRSELNRRELKYTPIDWI